MNPLFMNKLLRRRKKYTSENDGTSACVIKKALEMSDFHLADLNLSVVSLAELLDWTFSYLSRIFKRKMKQGDLDISTSPEWSGLMR